MSLLKFRNFAVFGAASMMGLGLIGVGAHAVFTTSTASSQTITAGSPSVIVYSADAPGCTTIADNCTSITLNPVGPVGSTFDQPIPLVPIYIKNTGLIPVTEGAIQLTDATNGPAGSYLQDQMNIYMSSDPGSNLGAGIPDNATIVANGPLLTGLALTPSVKLVGPTLAPGATDEYQVDFYAGQNSA